MTRRSALEARGLRRSNGVTEIVALNQEWWACFDFIIEELGEPVGEIVSFVERHLVENPKDEFAACVELYLHCRMQDHRAEFFGLANDDYLTD